MQPPTNDFLPQQGTPSPSHWPAHPEIESRESRNLLLLAAHQIVFRIGWVFKTESVIMPAFLDLVAGPGSGWLRGWMPMLNRFGQNVTPVFFAERLRATRLKKRGLAAYVLLMSLPLGLLALAWLAFGRQSPGSMIWLFLVLYFVFFVFNGLYHVSFGTVQGKLIRPTRRGRLLLVSTALGTIPAMAAVWWLLADWLKTPDWGFGCIFGWTAGCIFLSGLIVLALSEPPDDRPTAPRFRAGPKHAWRAIRRALSDTRHVLRRDANLRRLGMVAPLFGCSLIVFPHYQALARVLDDDPQWLMVFVIVQNAAVGAFSLLVGPAADAWGNRLTLRVLIFGSAFAPLLAIGLAHSGDLGADLYWLVFIPLGVTPLVFRILINYTLEVCKPDEHARYVSTVNLCLAAPFVFSPAVGWAVDAAGFEVVFLAAAGLVLLGGCLTFRLDEPRYAAAGDEIEVAGPTDGD